MKIPVVNTLPDFLGIGGARCGSTWLYENLQKHSEIWMPPRKEIHYFDRSPSYPSPNWLAESNPLKRLFGKSSNSRKFRYHLIKAFGADIIKNRSRLFWDINYYFRHVNDAWYASLFLPGKNKVKGECTPAYSILRSSDVARIKKIMPQLKIIYLLRNPIDRTWSQLRKNRQAILSQEKIKQIINTNDVALRNDYFRTIRVWREHFSNNQIFIGFYDDIINKPNELLTNIYNFLEVKVNQNIKSAKLAYKRVNEAPKKNIPDEIKVYLAEKLLLYIKDLSETFGGPAKKWHSDAESILHDYALNNNKL